MKMKQAMKTARGGKEVNAMMCVQFLKSGGGKCEKTNCRFSHDIEQFMKTKKKDLPGVCPFPRKECPFGLACRFSESHDGGRGEVPDKDNDAASVVLFDEPVANPRDDMNVVTNDVKFALSRRTFDFSRADRILKAMGLRTSNEVRGGGDQE